MRVTLASQTAMARNSMTSVFSKLVDAQEQVSTGKRIFKPSDDPVGTDQALAYSQSISDIDQYMTNATLAKNFMGQTSNALDAVYSQIQEVKTDTLAMNNASATAESRQALADKLDAVKQRLEDLANTQYLGRYIFSGQATDASPLGYQHTLQGGGTFTAQSTSGALTINGVSVPVLAGDTAADLAARINSLSTQHGVTAQESGGQLTLSMKSASTSNSINVSASGGYTLDDIFGANPAETSGTTLTYAGDTGSIRMQVGQSSYVTANMTGDKVFNMDGAAAAGQPDLFTLIDKVKSAILSGDSTQISTQLTSVNAASDRLLVQRTAIGGRIQNVEGVVSYQETTQDRLKELRSSVEDVDWTQAVINLKTQEQVYQSSLYSASTMLQVSLADYLK